MSEPCPQDGANDMELAATKLDGVRESSYGPVKRLSVPWPEQTEQYRYCLRCNPVRGDHQAYLTAFDLRVQEMHQAQEQEQATGLEQEESMTMDGIC